MIDIPAIAIQRAESTGFSSQEWEDVIFYGSGLESVGQLTDGEFQQLTNGCISPEAYRNVVNLFEGHLIGFPESTPAFDLLLEEVDASRFQMADWLSGLNWMAKWCEFHQKVPDYRVVLGYVKCCAMSLENTPEGALPETVKEMLETEGMD